MNYPATCSNKPESKVDINPRNPVADLHVGLVVQCLGGCPDCLKEARINYYWASRESHGPKVISINPVETPNPRANSIEATLSQSTK